MERGEGGGEEKGEREKKRYLSIRHELHHET